MGGTYKGIGNITLTTEINFRKDPEAIAMVLKEFKGIKLIPWETCKELEINKE